MDLIPKTTVMWLSISKPLKPGEWGQLLPPVTLFKACLSDDLHVVWTARRWEEKAGMAVIEFFEELLVIRPFGFILPRN